MLNISIAKNILAGAILTVLLSLSSVGFCAPGNADDAKETVMRAYQNLIKLNTYHMTMVSKTSLSARGKNISMTTESECDIQMKPMILKNVMTFTVDSASARTGQIITQYIEETAGQLAVYSNRKDQWTRQVVPYYDPLKEYDHYFKALVSATPVSEDEQSITFAVTESADYLQGTIKDAVASSGMPKTKLPENAFNDLGDFTYNVTIDKKSCMISRIDMDLSGLISKVGSSIAEAQDVPESQKGMVKELFQHMTLFTSIALSQWNQAGPITVPPEVKQAAIPLATASDLPDNIPTL